MFDSRNLLRLNVDPALELLPAHRPDRAFDASSGSDVHGSQPMLV